MLGTFNGWRAYSFKENGQAVCYMSLDAAKTPVKPPAKPFKRGTPRLMITHRPAENSKDVINYMGGYNFKTGSSASVHIGKTSFDLFTAKDGAWARDSATDHALAAAIRHNPALTITGTPAAKGVKPLTDRFDLTGATQAYQAIGKACGYVEDAVPVKKAAPKKVIAPAAKH